MIARISKSLNEKEKGFTLIELLVVVIIIGILSAIAIPVFMNQRQKAVDAGIKSDLRSVANEVETYYVDKQEYPASATASEGVIKIGATDISLSDDATAIVYTPNADKETYKITGVNVKKGSKLTFTYDSEAGGLDPEGTAPTN